KRIKSENFTNIQRKKELSSTKITRRKNTLKTSKKQLKPEETIKTDEVKGPFPAKEGGIVFQPVLDALLARASQCAKNKLLTYERNFQKRKKLK
ncbi:1122_t:CDS:2, partial [Dentiscutata heterogama]